MNTVADYRNQTITRHALRGLFLDLLAEARSHLNALHAKADPQELKAYRNSVGKLTALVREFGECMDSDIHTLLMGELDALRRPTDSLWDDERILGHLDDYRSMVRPQEHTTLMETTKELEESRHAALGKVRDFVRSSEYRNILTVLNDLCNEEKFYSRCSLNPLSTVLAEKCGRRLEALQNQAAAMLPDSSKKEWRRLGTQVDQLRYTLKAFAHLLDDEAARTVRRRLGKLAKTLHGLDSLTHQITRIETAFPAERKSISIILTILGLEKRHLRKKALKQAARLSDPEFLEAFGRLITPPSA